MYLKFYNLVAENVTVGTSEPIKTIMVPANGTIGVTPKMLPQFYGDVAISVAVTTGASDSDTGAPTTDLIADFSYT